MFNPADLSENVQLFFTAKKLENEHEQNDSATLPRTEVIKRLRERGHPIILFGENEVQSFRRLRRIEIQEPEANRVSFSKKNCSARSRLRLIQQFFLPNDQSKWFV